METAVIDELRKGLTEINDNLTSGDKKLTDLSASMKKVEADN